MKTATRFATAMSLAMTTAAYASNGVEPSSGSLLMWFFLCFIGVIIVMQLIPGMTLFVGLLRGIFSTFGKKEEAAAKIKGGE